MFKGDIDIKRTIKSKSDKNHFVSESKTDYLTQVACALHGDVFYNTGIL